MELLLQLILISFHSIYPFEIKAFSISPVLFIIDIKIGFKTKEKLFIFIFAPLDLMAFWTAVISFFKIGMVQREIETIREIFFVLILNILSGESNSSNVVDISAIVVVL